MNAVAIDPEFRQLEEPAEFFRNHHMIGDDARLKEIREYCTKHSLIPDIRETPGNPTFLAIWYGYLDVSKEAAFVHSGWESYLNKQYPLRRQPGRNGQEWVIEQALCEKLEKDGLAPTRQVRVSSGIIDVLTERTIYEIKDRLTRDAMLKAIGQVLIYRQDEPRPELVILGRSCDGLSLAPYAASMGIRVEVWKP